MDYLTNVKLAVYRHFAETGQGPTPSEIAVSIDSDEASVTAAYREL
jgi:hypothetical protein